MRAVINVQGADGHSPPLLLLARSLVADGHEITFITSAPYRKEIERRGFKAVGVDMPAGTTVGTEARRAALREMDADGRRRNVIGGFLEVSVAHCRAIVEQCNGENPPDVMIRETTAWGAWLAGELMEVPVATFDFSPAPVGLFASAVGDLFGDARASVGLPPDDSLESLCRWLTVRGGPPGWFPSSVFRPTTHLLQPPEDPSDDGALPGWFGSLPDRPNVYVTLGTTFNLTQGLFEMLFEAVKDIDANVIVTVGRTIDPGAFCSLPGNVHIEQFIPQGLLLPHCDAVVAHGGYGSLMGALRHGLPIVTIPLAAADNYTNAAKINRLGAGIAVEENDRSVQTIRAAVSDVLHRPQYRAAAQHLAAKMAGLPPFSTAVGLVERLATERRAIVAPQRS
ncbi:MAG: glycosyltransferase [Acidimicrobiales bacterium]